MKVSNLNKECVKSRLGDSAYTSFKQVSNISEKNLSKEEVKTLNKLLKKGEYRRRKSLESFDSYGRTNHTSPQKSRRSR